MAIPIDNLANLRSVIEQLEGAIRERDVLLQELFRPAHEREPPHCPTCCCGLSEHPNPALCGVGETGRGSPYCAAAGDTPLMTKLRVHVERYRWSGHGEGGTIASVRTEVARYGLHESTREDFARAEADAAYINALIEADEKRRADEPSDPPQ